MRAKEAGKPVIVSMGNVAGSGGYFVAMHADKIVAQPGTVTGSIGVYGGKLVVRELLEDKLGINGSPTCELQFDGVPAQLIGERKRGLVTYVLALLNGARIGTAAQSIGIAQAALQEARGSLAQAQASLNKARRDVARLQPLVAESAAPEVDLDNAESAVEHSLASIERAKAAIAVAELNLKFSEIHVPISGIIGKHEATPGNIVSRDQTLLTSISSWDPMRTVSSISETDYLRLGQQHREDNPFIQRKNAAPFELIIHHEPAVCQLPA